jgi:hypothetical protein
MDEIFISLLFGPIWNEEKENSVCKWMSVQILVWQLQILSKSAVPFVQVCFVKDLTKFLVF